MNKYRKNYLKYNIPIIIISFKSLILLGQAKYLPPSEFLSNTVIFINGYCDTIIQGQSAKNTFSGTGFFMLFRIDSDSVLCLVSNKHVVENICNAELIFTKANKDSLPLYENNESIELRDFNKKWIYSKEQDLAVLPISSTLNAFEKKFGYRAYFNYLTEEIIPTKQKIETFQFLEELLMIGYPKGIYDIKNNIPVFRKGFTASPYKFNFNGMPVFLADLPDFEGSSGSPVFLFSEGSYSPTGNYFNEFHEVGLRVYLLGINMGAYISEDNLPIYETSSGKSIEVPAFSKSKTYLDLGIIIKAEALFEFKNLLKGIK